MVDALELPFAFQESDIVVVDLSQQYCATESPSLEIDETLEAWWMSWEQGCVDWRPLTALQHAPLFDRMLERGAVFVLFVAPTPEFKVFRGRKNHKSLPVEPQGKASHLRLHQCLLPILEHIDVLRSGADSIQVARGTAFTQMFQELWSSTSVATANLTLSLPTWQQPRQSAIERLEGLAVLAKDTMERPVGLHIPPCGERLGHVVLLPQFANPGLVLQRLLEDVLPPLTPALFEASDSKWSREAPYELPEVLSLEAQAARLLEEARLSAAELRSKAQAARQQRAHEHALIEEQGSDLVDAVIRTFEELGFRNVVDSDVEAERLGRRLREDIRILGDDGVWLVEVKGVSGHPPEADSRQVTKHRYPVGQELGRLDIKAVTVVNHFRSVPPLDRPNEDVFGPVILQEAMAEGYAVMTTWDLLRLLRAYRQFGWTHEQAIRPLFHGTGRIGCIPAHYRPIGRIEKVRKKISVISVRLDDVLKCGERIGFAPNPWIRESKVTSMQLSNVAVAEAGANDLVGLKMDIGGLKAGLTVFSAGRPATGEPAS